MVIAGDDSPDYMDIHTENILYFSDIQQLKLKKKLILVWLNGIYLKKKPQRIPSQPNNFSNKNLHYPDRT